VVIGGVPLVARLRRGHRWRAEARVNLELAEKLPDGSARQELTQRAEFLARRAIAWEESHTAEELWNLGWARLWFFVAVTTPWAFLSFEWPPRPWQAGVALLIAVGSLSYAQHLSSKARLSRNGRRWASLKRLDEEASGVAGSAVQTQADASSESA
jgi:hypothetical protein